MIQECKSPSPKAILNGFCIVTVKVLNSYIINVISLLLSVINIYLAVSLGLWAESVGSTVAVAMIVALLLQYVLSGSFLRRRKAGSVT